MNVKDLDVYQLSHHTTLEVYRVTDHFPAAEKFNLIPQMRRAVSSICSNLVEGTHRVSRDEYRHCIGIARGSCGELKYQALLSRDLGYIEQSAYCKLANAIERISTMLSRLHVSLRETEDSRSH